MPSVPNIRSMNGRLAPSPAYVTDRTAKKTCFKASAVVMSTFAMPARTPIPMPDFPSGAVDKRTTFPAFASSSIASRGQNRDVEALTGKNPLPGRGGGAKRDVQRTSCGALASRLQPFERRLHPVGGQHPQTRVLRRGQARRPQHPRRRQRQHGDASISDSRGAPDSPTRYNRPAPTEDSGDS